MSRHKINFGLIILAALSVGCVTDAEIAKFTAYGNQTSVTCYSGGVVIYDGISTGRVKSPERSDGWQFMDLETGMLMEVSGDCIIAVK